MLQSVSTASPDIPVPQQQPGSPRCSRHYENRAPHFSRIPGAVGTQRHDPSRPNRETAARRSVITSRRSPTCCGERCFVWTARRETSRPCSAAGGGPIVVLGAREASGLAVVCFPQGRRVARACAVSIKSELWGHYGQQIVAR